MRSFDGVYIAKLFIGYRDVVDLTNIAQPIFEAIKSLERSSGDPQVEDRIALIQQAMNQSVTHMFVPFPFFPVRRRLTRTLHLVYRTFTSLPSHSLTRSLIVRLFFFVGMKIQDDVFPVRSSTILNRRHLQTTAGGRGCWIRDEGGERLANGNCRSALIESNRIVFPLFPNFYFLRFLSSSHL